MVMIVVVIDDDNSDNDDDDNGESDENHSVVSYSEITLENYRTGSMCTKTTALHKLIFFISLFNVLNVAVNGG